MRDRKSIFHMTGILFYFHPSCVVCLGVAEQYTPWDEEIGNIGGGMRPLNISGSFRVTAVDARW